MTKTRDELFRQALALGDADKGELIAALIHSLDSRIAVRAEAGTGAPSDIDALLSDKELDLACS